MSSSQLISEKEEGFGDHSQEEDGESVERGEAEVAVARPPLCAAPSVELVVSGQAALDSLEQVLASSIGHYTESSFAIRRDI